MFTKEELLLIKYLVDQVFYESAENESLYNKVEELLKNMS